MRMRERDGMYAVVDVGPADPGACRVLMSVAHEGRPIWTSVRYMRLADSDCATMERTALEAVTAIADHLRKRNRPPARPRRA